MCFIAGAVNGISLAICMCVCVGWVEVCQISLVVIKIAAKHPSRLLNPAALWLADRRSRGEVQSVAVPCLEPALSGACLPTASAAALSGSYYTHWQLKEAPFLLIFEDYSSLWATKRALPGNAITLYRFRLVLYVLGSIFGCVSLTQGSFLPFSVGMPLLARIVQSLWRLLSLQSSHLTDKGKFFRGYAWHSPKRSSVSAKLFGGQCRNEHCLILVLLADMLSLDAEFFSNACLPASLAGDTIGRSWYSPAPALWRFMNQGATCRDSNPILMTTPPCSVWAKGLVL